MKQKKDAPDVMGALKPKPRRGRPPKKKPKTADTIATELENEAKRLLYHAMLLRGKQRLSVKVAEKTEK